jgi:hypothetical protein
VHHEDVFKMQNPPERRLINGFLDWATGFSMGGKLSITLDRLK